MRSFKTFAGSRDGNISVMVALALPVLVGAVALVVEFGQGLLDRAENQRVADLAAFAGALAYSSTSSTSAMNAAVARVAGLNGIDVSKVSASLVESPRSAKNTAVTVQIATSRNLVLAPILGAQSTLPVVTDAYAEVSGNATPPCIIALSGSESGVTLSGGTTISAPECAVASNNTVSVPCGTKLTTTTVIYNSATAPSQPCSGIVAPSGKQVTITKAETADPLSADAGVATATGRLTTVAALAAPSAPSVTVATGTDLEFAWWEDPAFKTKVAATGCMATYSGGWIITCPAGGTYNFGTVTIQNAKQFAASGGGTATFNFKGTLTVNSGPFTFGPGTYNLAKGLSVSGGATATFGDGTYTIAQGITTAGGTTTTFGAGTFTIGATASNCGSATHSICNSGSSLIFGGPSTFVLSSGIYNAGGSSLTLGSGTANSFKVGPSSAGNALMVGGGSKTTFADATGDSSVFEMAGNFNMSNGGGSCVAVGAAAHHDIKGFLAAAGGTILGAGVYTVNGYIAFGATGGGNVTCNGKSVGVSGSGVTLVASGATVPSSGTCKDLSFCAAAGYSNITLTAPTAGTTAKLLVVGPAAKANGASFSGGASASLSGVFYFPKGPITLSGGASVGNGAGDCLQIVGSRVTLSGGTAAASACISSGGGTGDKVVIVQ